MSRSRLDPERKKVSFSLAFSPNLIAALENVRGAKSQSVFVEEWLRQNPSIAAELVSMNDAGFLPPVARYEQLMDLLLVFYSPEDDEPSTLQTTLFIAQKVLLRNRAGRGQDIEEQISAAMKAFWLKERSLHGGRRARGESLEVVLPDINEYARYFYQVIFLEMVGGEHQQLQHRFRSLVHGCEAVYRERMKRR